MTVETLLRNLSAEIAHGLGLAGLFLLPFAVIVLLARRQRNRLRAMAEDPFTEMPLRPPGESLRLKIEEISSDIDAMLLGAGCASAAGAVLVLSVTHRWSWSTALGGCVGIALVYVWVWLRLRRNLRELWDHQLGFMGERVVGEELHKLASFGYLIFHDLPFENFNVDHVVVGPAGVFVIETKARRKPASIKGPEKARVVFDGVALHYPMGKPQRSAIDQARLNAETVAKWLTKATGEPVTAQAIVALPGWFLPPAEKQWDVWVLNPKWIGPEIGKANGARLALPQIRRIAHQLSERCRIVAPGSAPIPSS